ncbi:hypothetical protein CDAR_542291 [Caerostris darwini]|uniref:Uncharacterized protein n=1 Tax=Caerostris darwini TaxID=1538125 RepID=A0AAV4PHJ7_9ARAC|nr:hypothetical protein CDAR_542291 [Caerostris darwini]
MTLFAQFTQSVKLLLTILYLQNSQNRHHKDSLSQRRVWGEGHKSDRGVEEGINFKFHSDSRFLKRSSIDDSTGDKALLPVSCPLAKDYLFCEADDSVGGVGWNIRSTYSIEKERSC